MAAVGGRKRQKHVTASAARMGEVTLLQDHHLVPHIVVQKVHPDICPDRFPYHGTPSPGMPATHPPLGKTHGTCWDTLGGGRLPSGRRIWRRAASVGDLPVTLLPSPPHTTCIRCAVSGGPDRLDPPPSSVVHTLHWSAYQ